jgi:uncharacterized protein (TIGR02466 family)
MENIIELLPIPVYHKSNAFSISDDLIVKMESADMETMKDLYTVLGEDANPIVDKLNEHLRYYSSEVLGIDPVVWFEIVKAFLIKIRPDEPMYIHNHSNCVAAAVYYITDPPESSPLVFFNETNILKNFNFLLPYAKETPYNKNVYKIYPKKGDIIIFPSWLYHMVPKNESNENRYSISSHAWMKGEIPSDIPNAWERNFNLSSNTIYSPNLKFK